MGRRKKEVENSKEFLEEKQDKIKKRLDKKIENNSIIPLNNIPIDGVYLKPLTNPEAREQRLIGVVLDAVEKMILETGTAPAPVLAWFCRRASGKEELETLKLKKQIDLIDAQIESLKSQKKIEEMYKEAMDAMQSYGRVFDVSKKEEVLDDDEY